MTEMTHATSLQATQPCTVLIQRFKVPLCTRATSNFFYAIELFSHSVRSFSKYIVLGRQRERRRSEVGASPEENRGASDVRSIYRVTGPLRPSWRTQLAGPTDGSREDHTGCC